jgi:hypothetical protein
VPRANRRVLITLALLLGAVLLVLPFVLRRTTSFYRGGAGLREPEERTRGALREVLWERPEPLDAEINLPDRDQYEPRLSPDGEVLVFTRGRPGENADLWEARRQGGRFSHPRPLEEINSPEDDLGASFGPDGRVLLFYSNRPGGQGGFDLWICRRADTGWEPPRNLGPAINGPANEIGPALSADGRRLFFSSDRRPGAVPADGWRGTLREPLRNADFDIYLASAHEETFDEPVAVAALNREGSSEGAVALSPSGDFLYFASNRPGGQGGFDLYRSRLTDGLPGPPEPLGPQINSPLDELDPALASNGFQLYLARGGGEGRESIQAAWSREVFLERERGEPYLSAGPLLSLLRRTLERVIPWLLGLSLTFVVALALLLLLLGLNRRLRTLSLLGRCFVFAFLLHLVLAAWMQRKRVGEGPERAAVEPESQLLEVSVGGDPEEGVGLAIREALAETGTGSEPLPLERRGGGSANVPEALPGPVAAFLEPLAPSRLPAVPPAAPAPLEIDRPALALEIPPPRTDPEPEALSRSLAPPVPPPALPEMRPPAIERRREAAGTILERGPAEPGLPVLIGDLASGPMAPPAARRELPGPVEGAPGLSAGVAAEPMKPLEILEPPAPAGPRGPPRASPEPSVPDEAPAPALARRRDGIAGSSAIPAPAAFKGPLEPGAGGPGSQGPAGTGKAGPGGTSRDELARAVRPLPLGEPGNGGPRGAGGAAGGEPGYVPKLYRLREGPGRGAALEAGGGSPLTERAVERGLAWLALHQSPDGRWSLRNYTSHLPRPSERDLFHSDWNGRGPLDSRGGGGTARNGDTAGTGLGLLAFLGHGESQLKEGPHRETVRRALAWLLRAQKADGDLRGGGTLYMHGMAAFALSEAYAFTRDPALEEPAERALRFTVHSQNPDLGGWRYLPYPESDQVDTSVFGWMLMALKSARLGGLPVEEECLERAARYLRSARMAGEGGRYAYQPGVARTSLAMTAQGHFCELVLADLRHPDEETADKAQIRGPSVATLLANLPRAADQDGANFYYWYYGSLALFQEGGQPWKVWNRSLSDLLVRLQVGEDQGTAAGSWDPLSRRDASGGRVYATAMGVLCLEVYYRYGRLGQDGAK